MKKSYYSREELIEELAGAKKIIIRDTDASRENKYAAAELTFKDSACTQRDIDQGNDPIPMIPTIKNIEDLLLWLLDKDQKWVENQGILLRVREFSVVCR